MTHQRPAVDRTVTIEGIAHVEGEGSLHVEVRDGSVGAVELEIFEPPRFFEAFLRGRRHTEAPDITARICGICPVAYQMSACLAIEDACGVAVTGPISRLRRLLVLRRMDPKPRAPRPSSSRSGLLRLPGRGRAGRSGPVSGTTGTRDQALGNLVMEAVGGRAVHPVNVRVGGFYRAPSTDEISASARAARQGRDAALASVEWVAGFEFPDLEAEYRFVSLRHPDHYPIESGRVASSDGLDLDAEGISDLVVEEHVERSTALQARLGGQDVYLTGPLAATR